MAESAPLASDALHCWSVVQNRARVTSITAARHAQVETDLDESRRYIMTKQATVKVLTKQSARAKATQELAGARHLLKTLREKIGAHPELEEAIERVE